MKRSGFTLIELMAVIAVIAILTGIAMGTLQYVQDRAERSRAEAEVELLRNAVEEYRLKWGDYPNPWVGGAAGAMATEFDNFTYKGKTGIDSIEADMQRMWINFHTNNPAALRPPPYRMNPHYPEDYIAYIASGRLLDTLESGGVAVEDSLVSVLDRYWTNRVGGVTDIVGRDEYIGNTRVDDMGAVRGLVDPWGLPYMYEYVGPGQCKVWSFGWQTESNFYGYGDFDLYDPDKRIGDR
jgi:prepilin-type N-terminal cleavage/methylation domain-containing protein